MSREVCDDDDDAAIRRPSVNYHPNIWGDYFLKYGSEEGDDSSSTVWECSSKKHIETLVAEVRAMLVYEASDPSAMLNVIDQVQRFGVAYHFEDEINKQLARLHDTYSEFCSGCEDLFTVALFFRLLRQDGYSVSCEAFGKFKDDRGLFRRSLVQDVRGLLSLYEASHMMIHGEDILEEALAFTTTHLKSIDEEEHSPFLVKLARHALQQPLRRAYQRLQSYQYILIYREDPARNEVIFSLAKSDFRFLQELHQKEASHIAKWWKHLEFARKFPFARDRAVEDYFWNLGAYFEPKYSFARKFLSKMFTMATIMDDMYDAHGTLDELKLFTETLQRWDISDVDGLPEYGQHHYKELFEIYGEIEEQLANKGHLYRLHYAKESIISHFIGGNLSAMVISPDREFGSLFSQMKMLARAYLAEHEWLHRNYTPTIEEYSDLAAVTLTVPMLAMHSLVGMDEVMTKDTCEWLSSYPTILKSVSEASRYIDDLRGYKFERMRDHIPSSISCLMKQYGFTEQEAEEDLMKRVSNAWKDINEASLRPFTVPEPVLRVIVNFVRTCSVMYEDGDNYTNSTTKMKDYITAILVDPLPL